MIASWLKKFITRREMPRRKGPVFAFGSRTFDWQAQTFQTLLDAEPVFSGVIKECDREIQKWLGWSLVEELGCPPETFRLDGADEFFMPTLTALQIAQAVVWRERGLEPAAVIGLSAGEFAAAHIAGALTLAEALKVVCGWGPLFRANHVATARTLAVTVSPSDADALERSMSHSIFLTVQLAPTTTIFSGEAEPAQIFATMLEEKGIPHQWIPTKYAFHTPMLDNTREAYVQLVGGLNPRPPLIPIYSPLTGARLGQKILDGLHWWQVGRQPVLFTPAVRSALADGYMQFLEFGLSATLSLPIKAIAENTGVRIASDSALDCYLRNETPFAPRTNVTANRRTGSQPR